MTPTRDYFASRAIDPQVAYDAGVRPGRNANELAFPNGRRRLLNEGRVLGQKGRPLAGWRIGDADGPWETVLVCEGESDSLAALTALRAAPEATGLRSLPILCIPGTPYPVERLISELIEAGVKTALLALDPDEAGSRYVAEAWWRLVDVSILPVRIEVPEPDLAGWLVDVDEEKRGDFLAALIADCQANAPGLDWLRNRRKAAWHRAEAERLEAVA